MAHPIVVATRADLRAHWPELEGVVVVGIDLRDEPLDWSAARVASTMFMGCRLPAAEHDRLEAAGAVVLSRFPALPFEPYRAALYTYDELVAGHESDGPTLDARIGAWFVESSTGMYDAVVRALHDATIDAAVAQFVVGRRMVGVMGGHALGRDTTAFGRVAELGRALTRAGYTVATGGGPGVMEAANLGAWLAPVPEPALATACDVLAAAPDATRDSARSSTPRSRCGRSGPMVRRAWAFRRGCTSTNRRRRSRRTSRSTSPTASGRMACWRSRVRASCTRRAAPAPNKRSSPMPPRTA
jgi:hypothetical protein